MAQRRGRTGVLRPQVIKLTNLAHDVRGAQPAQRHHALFGLSGRLHDGGQLVRRERRRSPAGHDHVTASVRALSERVLSHGQTKTAHSRGQTRAHTQRLRELWSRHSPLSVAFFRLRREDQNARRIGQIDDHGHARAAAPVQLGQRRAHRRSGEPSVPRQLDLS